MGQLCKAWGWKVVPQLHFFGFWGSWPPHQNSKMWGSGSWTVMDPSLTLLNTKIPPFRFRHQMGFRNQPGYVLWQHNKPVLELVVVFVQIVNLFLCHDCSAWGPAALCRQPQQLPAASLNSFYGTKMFCGTRLLAPKRGFIYLSSKMPLS